MPKSDAPREAKITDKELANEIRSHIAAIATLMNVAKRRGIQVTFNIGNVPPPDGPFVATSKIIKGTPPPPEL